MSYSTQSAFSDPRDLAPLYAGLPEDPARLARIARDLMIHRVEGDTFGYVIPRERLHHDAETRHLADILRIIVDRNDAPLTQWREPRDRFVGVCRDFALLLCSFLRHFGIPARVRSGFADYLGPDGFHGDHVVTEFRDDRHGWRLADPMLTDPAHVDTARVDFDPMDVPRNRFLVAGRAWQAIRAGTANPDAFGVHPPEEGPLVGEWFVAHDMRIDLAALNKVETLLWDTWGAGRGGDRTMTDEIRALYDRVADDECGHLFAEHEELRPPATVISLAPFLGPREVALSGPGGNGGPGPLPGADQRPGRPEPS